jgi:ADP-ribosylglycohydrolase
VLGQFPAQPVVVIFLHNVQPILLQESFPWCVCMPVKSTCSRWVRGNDNSAFVDYINRRLNVCFFLKKSQRVQDAVMVTQTNPKAIRFAKAAAALLEQVLLGRSLKGAMELLVEQTMSSTSYFSADDDASDLGDACLTALMEAKTKETAAELMKDLPEKENQGSARFPVAMIVPLFLFYQAIASGDVITEESYIKAVRANILAGGDTCCRAIVLGAILAAAAGSVPDSFLEQFMPRDVLKRADDAVAGIIESIG